MQMMATPAYGTIHRWGYDTLHNLFSPNLPRKVTGQLAVKEENADVDLSGFAKGPP